MNSITTTWRQMFSSPLTFIDKLEGSEEKDRFFWNKKIFCYMSWEILV